MSNKTIYQIYQLKLECEHSDISSMGTKNDLQIILDQRICDKGLNPHSTLFSVNVSQNSYSMAPRTGDSISMSESVDNYIDEEFVNLRLSFG